MGNNDKILQFTLIGDTVTNLYTLVETLHLADGILVGKLMRDRM